MKGGWRAGRRLAGVFALLLTAPPGWTQAPDLKVYLRAPASATAGGVVTPALGVLVTNNGHRVAPGTASADNQGYMVDLFLTRGPIPSGFATYAAHYRDGVLLKGGRISNTGDVAVGAQRLYRVRVTLPADTPAGEYRLCAKVDPGEVVVESDESNNLDCRPLHVAAPTLLAPLPVSPNVQVVKPLVPAGGAVSAPGKTTRRVLPDGTMEIALPDGSRRQLRPDGRLVTVRPDGSVIVPYALQVQGAELPALPAELAGWGAELNQRLLDILRGLLSEAEFEAYLHTEQGKDFYQLTDWRLRSIGFLTSSP